MYVKVPKDRVAVLIGQNGETRKWLEDRSGVKLDIDSKDNEVVIHDEAPEADPVMALKMQDIVRAIGRGFSPQRAARLFRDEAFFEVFDIHDFVGKHKGHVRRIASRVIGSDGKTRRIIEEQTGADLAIQGHTVAVIADIDGLADAKHAVEMLLRGAEHASVYRFLERKRRESRRTHQDLW